MVRSQHNFIHPRSSRHRGVASVLAMLFLTLFATLAVGFYASTTMSVQVSRNEERVLDSQFAAESGMQWYRRQMVRVNFSPSATPATSFSNLYTQLSTQLNGTTNMGGHNLTQGTDASGNSVIYIPGTSGSGASLAYNWMNLGGSGQGRLTITLVGNDFIAKSIGASTSSGAPVRAVQWKYALMTGAYTMPAAGLLTKAPVTLSNGAEIAGGSVLCATSQGVASLTMSGGAKIDKDYSYTSSAKPPAISGGASVAGHIYANAAAPSFPQIDPSVFSAFVPNASAPQGPKVLTSTSTLTSLQVFTNIRIKANANTSFGNSQVLNGVIYIESPNKVTFGGAVKVTGIIVTENDTSKPITGNTITIGNGVTVSGVENLNSASFAASENIDTLKTMSGALILAPTYKVTLQGGSQTYNDSLIASQFDISNGYRGTIAGSLINLDDTAFTMTGGGLVTFTSGGVSTIPGLSGGQQYSVDLTSYAEVAP